LANSLENNVIARPIDVVREVVVAMPALLAAYAPVDKPEDFAHIPCLVNYHFRNEPHWMVLPGGESTGVIVDGPVMDNTYQGIHRLALLGTRVARLPR
jgi:hypothetical protein